MSIVERIRGSQKDDPPRTDCDVDEIVSLLSTPRRRHVVRHAARDMEDSDTVTLSELADYVAAIEAGGVDFGDQQRKRVYVSLYQTHIPKLEDAGVITYDQDSGRVAIRDRIDQLDRYIPHRDRTTIDWRRVYLAVAVVGGIAYALVAFDVSVFAAASEAATGALILLALLAVVAVQYLTERDGARRLTARRGRDRQQ